MFTCNECIRTFSKHASIRNHVKTHAVDHIDEQIHIASEELKKSTEKVRYSPVKHLPIIEDIIEDISDREYENNIDISSDDSDEILGTDIINDDKYNEINNLSYLLFVILIMII
ncbi:11934_t:CDS:1 [Funneliformis geosporum]|uniref:11934_t:CDS:1 n=1 Tax=Funneliformis geosporum TaxID=1117311 RepID=A0A9W4X4M3_9GLOM|nr:11934_t:CDS:1 [Funneliformis geosporum]